MVILPEGGSWKAALDLYLQQRGDLYAGRPPSAVVDGKLSIKDLCNRFLTDRSRKIESSELVQRTFWDYQRVTDRLITIFGKNRLVADLHPKDFAALRAEISKSNGLVALNGEITRTKVVFNFAINNQLLEQPISYGTAFDWSTAKSLRQAKAQVGPRMFEAEQCWMLIDTAHTPELRAMILLALNCGFGNSDCAKLPRVAVDLDLGWVAFARPKTGVERWCPLWTETLQALHEVLGRRDPERDLVFVTQFGNSFENDGAAISKEFRKLLDENGLHRKGLGFYALRHTFRTIADETGDIPAVRLIMGHADDSIDAVYRERISDERLQAVTEHVRRWLLPVEEVHLDQPSGRPQLLIVG